MTDTTDDGFLGGRLRLLQPKAGYRAGVDPVLLAAAVPARAGESVLDIGCGVGAAMLCLGRRVPGLDLLGVERHERLAALALENARRNDIPAEIVVADLLNLPKDVRERSFDHVITNPPFFDRAKGSPAGREDKEAGRGETVPLSDWLDASLRRLGPRGRLSVIQHAGRLPDILTGLAARLGDITVLPICARQGRDASLVIVTGRKGSRAAARIAFPFVMHEGAAHLRDGDDYAPEARAVLREGAPLPLAD
ncbi:methyltransferase [Alphaproteobacteria bacterium GH1-50]|uniref:Methyltransferase n=1 Tax=Kangsaoukella pontilimi TaxID=2691042 RepID=A0A7C9IHW6_9RHOB|nr:methyltransferase [Kangsaoukella pontilimi]MXQ09284.1 methyltransferase [Kangsaoukella pontilimi]